MYFYNILNARFLLLQQSISTFTSSTTAHGSYILTRLFCFQLSAAGELSVRVIDSLLGIRPKLWEFSGKTGAEEGAWQHVNVPVGFRKDRFQVSSDSPYLMLALMMRFDRDLYHLSEK